MISIMECMVSFFGNWTNFGERTPRSVFSVTDGEAKPQSEFNRKNLIIRKEGINLEDNN
jgi:hypothetical protein